MTWDDDVNCDEQLSIWKEAICLSPSFRRIAFLSNRNCFNPFSFHSCILFEMQNQQQTTQTTFHISAGTPTSVMWIEGRLLSVTNKANMNTKVFIMHNRMLHRINQYVTYNYPKFNASLLYKLRFQL
jgi:hypothetical protein